MHLGVRDRVVFEARVLPVPLGVHVRPDVIERHVKADVAIEIARGIEVIGHYPRQGLRIAFHGQSGDIMFQGVKSDKVQDAFDAINEAGFDLGLWEERVDLSFTYYNAVTSDVILLTPLAPIAAMLSLTGWALLPAVVALRCLGASWRDCGPAALKSLRAKLSKSDREKLDRYQERYQEYVRVAKGLQSLLDTPRQ